MKMIFVIAFLFQHSSWKVKEVDKIDNHVYKVHVSRKKTVNNVSGTVFTSYTTDVVKCPEKLGLER